MQAENHPRYNVIVALPAEIRFASYMIFTECETHDTPSAASILIDYWSKTRINNAIFIAVCLVVVVTINLLGAGAFGMLFIYFSPNI